MVVQTPNLYAIHKSQYYKDTRSLQRHYQKNGISISLAHEGPRMKQLKARSIPKVNHQIINNCNSSSIQMNNYSKAKKAYQFECRTLRNDKKINKRIVYVNCHFGDYKKEDCFWLNCQSSI